MADETEWRPCGQCSETSVYDCASWKSCERSLPPEQCNDPEPGAELKRLREHVATLERMVEQHRSAGDELGTRAFQHLLDRAKKDVDEAYRDARYNYRLPRQAVVIEEPGEPSA